MRKRSMWLITAASVLIVSTFCLVIGILCSGNFWYTEDSVLRQLRARHASNLIVLKTERNILASSVIWAEFENGKVFTFSLDSNYLLEYRFGSPVYAYTSQTPGP